MGKKETSSLSDDFLHSLGQDFSVLRDIVVNNPYAILLFDKDGYFLFANKSFLTNFKYSVPAEYSIFKDPNIQQIAHHEDWLSTIKGGHTLDIPELWYDIQKFTSEALEQKKCFHITIFPISIASTIKYYGIMIDDITEKTRIQKELVQYRDHLEELVKERERRIIQEQDLLRNFVYNNPYAIGIFGKNGNFIQSNPAFIQIFRSLPPKDFTIFSSAFQAKYSDKLQQLKQLKKGEKLIIEETWYNLHEIHPILPENRLGLRITVFPLNNVDNKPDNFVIMIEDVTKKMEYEEELAKKDIEVQYFGIISMISSMFIHDITKIDENISSSLNKLGDSINCSAVFLFQHIQIAVIDDGPCLCG